MSFAAPSDVASGGYSADRGWAYTALHGDAPTEAFDRLAHIATRALQVPLAVVSLVDEAEQVLIGCHGVEDLIGGMRRLPSSHGLCPFGLTASVPFLVSDISTEPELSQNASARALGLAAYGAAALVLDGEPIGTLCAVDTAPHQWDESDPELLIGVAASVVTELVARRARDRLESHTRQLHELAEASGSILRSGLSVEALMNEITWRARSVIGAHQSVSSLMTGVSTTQWITAIDLSDRYAAWRSYQVQPDGSGIYAMVPEIGRPVRMTQDELEAHPRWRGFGAEVDRHPPMRGWLAAPLIGREGQALGLIQLSDKDEGDFTAEDEALLVQLANLAAFAVEEACMLAERDHIADALHASVLPGRMPAIPGMEAVTRYQAGGPGHIPAGEFYDLCETPDGAWAITTADISGTGPGSTAVASLVRHTLRALVDEPSPAVALGRLNSTMLLEGEDLRFATVAHARVRLDGDPRVTVACAGHTAPILLRPGEKGRPLGTPGQVVGAIPGITLEEEEFGLRPGDTLVLYTAGVVETWRGDTSTLVDLADKLTKLSTASPEEIADALEAIAEDPRRKVSNRDFAILVLRLR
jgi:GAF domain-containing protein